MSTAASGRDVAIIGMACRFPGASTPEQFWANLTGGVSSIRTFTPDELLAAGVAPDLVRHPDYVPSAGYLDGAEDFDPGLFRIPPAEARITDPQHRLFLECVWDALERAGYDPQRLGDARIGCFGGAGMALYAGNGLSSYFSENLARSSGLLTELAPLQAFIATQSDHLCTRVSHRLGLRGPSVGVQTACSTGLVALHLACQSLLTGETDMALAGAAGVHFPLRRGYVYEEGGFLSPDGVCRPFDAAARGTVGGSGAGVVLLRRLQDALADGDPICAVIKGSAVNNDGALRAGYLAPSAEGQADVIRTAHRMAGITPDDIGYLEAHGTGTSLGDAIEVSALTQVFGAGTGGEIGLGSVKSNIGHLDTAAGLPGLMKAAMALEHGLIPATLNFTTPNPALRLDSSPFFVVSENTPWIQDRSERLAGISSFGGGGTNAHVVLAAAPERPAARKDDGPYLLTLSARSPEGLRRQAEAYADHVAATEQDLADVCATARTARPAFAHRAAVAATDADTLVERLRTLARHDVAADPAASPTGDQQPVFLFSGQGGALAETAWSLYQRVPAFRSGLDECLRELGEAGPTLLELLRTDAPALHTEARWAQLGLFCFQYALTGVWTSAGIRPAAVLGHSLGEYAAACAAGVLDLPDALRLVTARGRLMDELCPAGSLLAVMETEERVRDVLVRSAVPAEIAVVNGERAVVVGGSPDALAKITAELGTETVTTAVGTTHAFHTSALDPMREEFERAAGGVRFREPTVPFVSSMAGGAELSVADPAYWVRQVRETVRFGDALKSLLDGHRLFLEIGPAAVLSGHGRSSGADAAFVPSVQRRRDTAEALAQAAARLHVLGTPVDTSRFCAPGSGRRVLVPTSHRIRERYWIDPVPAAGTVTPEAAPTAAPEAAPATDGTLFHGRTVWEPAPGPLAETPSELSWSVLGSPGNPVAVRLAEAIRAHTGSCELRAPGEAPPSGTPGTLAAGVVCVPDPTADPAPAGLPDGVATVAALLRGYADGGTAAPRRLVLLTTRAQSTGADSAPDPAHAALWGLARSARTELTETAIHCVDTDGGPVDAGLVADLVGGADPEVAYRDGVRLLARIAPVAGQPGPPRLDPEATYLVTGGAGALGARALRRLYERGARHLVALGRSAGGAGIGETILEELRADGLDLLRAQVDVTDFAQLESLFTYLASAYPPVRGIVHAAGVLDDATLANLTPEALARVLAPKLDGTRHLDRLTERLDLDFFVCFSSITATLGAPAQAAYAAANAAMDAVAAGRRARGQRAASVQWGPWSGGGMHTALGERPRSTSRGLGELSPEQGMSVLDHVLAAAPDTTLAARLHGPRADADPVAFARRLTTTTPPAEGAVPVAAGAVAAELRALRPWQRPARMTDYVAGAVATLLGERPGGLDTEAPFIELGLDSLLGLRLRSRLRQDLDIRLTPTYSFDYPTITELSAHLVELIE
ncbi:type I polyketide synthase [Streptomyces roseolus]|uniref:type I polyketide synthase n=1 Tax=Streptomyces roseolus TaxID=67358 RepID=UPI00365E3FF7